MELNFRMIGCYIMKHDHTEIIVVEDDMRTRKAVVEILICHGLYPYEADSADEALFVMAAHPRVAILFTDIEMPGGMNGIELADRIHRVRSDIGIIVTSGSDCGARPLVFPQYAIFLGKPYRPKQLLDAVDCKLAQANPYGKSKTGVWL